MGQKIPIKVSTSGWGGRERERERERSAYAWSLILNNLLSSQSDGFDGNNT
jgi:hypothetical protein